LEILGELLIVKIVLHVRPVQVDGVDSNFLENCFIIGSPRGCHIKERRNIFLADRGVIWWKKGKL
jgi:hypothetical protein